MEKETEDLQKHDLQEHIVYGSPGEIYVRTARIETQALSINGIGISFAEKLTETLREFLNIPDITVRFLNRLDKSENPDGTNPFFSVSVSRDRLNPDFDRDTL